MSAQKNSAIASNFSSCTWASMAHAGWTHRVIARQGNDAVVLFHGPNGAVEKRTVPWDRLPSGDRHGSFAVPQRKVVVRCAFH